MIRSIFARVMKRVVVAALGFAVGVGHAETGRIVDKATGQPIANSFAIAIWQGDVPNPVISSLRCYSFAIVKADSTGTFSLPDRAPEPAFGLVNKEKVVGAFAPGYRMPTSRPALNPTIEMVKISGDEKRLRSLISLVPAECVVDRREKELLPALRVALEEAKSIAAGNADLERKYVRTIERTIDRISKGKVE